MARKVRQSLVSPHDAIFIAELMLKNEPLDPKLRRYRQDAGHGLVFRHPLLVFPGVNVEQATWINWTVQQ